jgi:hypothetical protein
LKLKLSLAKLFTLSPGASISIFSDLHQGFFTAWRLRDACLAQGLGPVNQGAK